MSLRSPTHLGRYEILDEIGRGAMGVVFMAKDPLIGRLVALKTFRATEALQGKDLEMFRARFIREAQSAGILSHPNIVTIHDVVEESEEGVTFIAMEYVRGTNLKEVLRTEGRLELEEAEHIVAEVAEGLEYAHSRGVIHRDVKPANILLNEERTVKLTDFGIARLGTSNLTHDGQLLGTPNYMAPEQIRGEAADHRADVFSLGVVLYEMLTGEKPFQGDNVTVVTHRIAYEAFIPPDRHGPGLPEPVERVLERALAKDPDLRFPSVAEAARALREAVHDVRNREVLNETQEIPEAAPPPTSTVTPPPAPAAADHGSAAAALAAFAGRARSGARAVGGAIASGARRLGRRVPSRPAEAGWRPLRPVAVAAATALVAGLLGWLLVGVAERSARTAGAELEVSGVDETLHAQRLRALPVLRQAHAAVRGGQREVAEELYRAAERLAPDLQGLAASRRRAGAEAETVARSRERTEQVATLLDEAGAAAEAGRWDEARSAAREVLERDQDNERARELVAASDEALEQVERDRRARAARERRAQEDRAPEEEDRRAAVNEADPGEGAESAAATGETEGKEAVGEATLALDFFSAYPEGVLTVYFDGTQLLREPYRFYRRGRFFRGEGTAGRIEGSYTVDAGAATLRVLVALPDRPAMSRVLQANFPTGTSRLLEIRLEEDQDLTIRLE